MVTSSLPEIVFEEIGAPVGVVYGIRDVATGDLRYVGQTAAPVRRRFAQHLRVARSGRKTPLYDWLRSRPTDRVEVVELEKVYRNREELGIAEMAWISYMRERGARLLNIADGGLGPTGVVWSREQREAARERSTGRLGTPRPGVANPFYGMAHSPLQRAIWSESRRGSISGEKNPNFGKFGSAHPSFGRTLSDETKARLSEQKRGAKNPNFGKTASDETRAKMSAARKGRPMPSSARSAHTRHHTNKGITSPTCSYCAENSALDSSPESETEK
ncbi:NUMOD3 domain-containing DNA-binding protein [Herbiconiux sp. CPCC 205763]|uniref:NUMOD3 domain-containing DNA-binding protein n=1 Tax=Herbiconiux aconitum TaxID=2970913 RepID=A0ABT2GMP2_9MICO|nr:NUMOD3 domain-containing DNA-binding protein [Herbiconiux aconitum]MCS5716852.1 NUMOD3 domain-containing DNA-binding protein [Herbiconiux aconitum]